MKLLIFPIFSLLLTCQNLNAFELRQPKKGACLQPKMSLSFSDENRKIGLMKCEEYLETYAGIYEKLNKLSGLKPFSEEKLIDTFGKDWRMTLKDLNSDVVKLKGLHGKRNALLGISNPLADGLNLDNNFIDELHKHHLDLMDQTYNAVMANRIQMKDYSSVRTDSTAIWLFFLDRNTDNYQKMPRTSYLSNYLNCNHATGLFDRLSQNTACEYAKLNKQNYNALISSDQKNSTPASAEKPQAEKK